MEASSGLELDDETATDVLPGGTNMLKLARYQNMLPNARGEERSDGRVRTMLLLVSTLSLTIRFGALALLERLTTVAVGARNGH